MKTQKRLIGFVFMFITLLSIMSVSIYADGSYEKLDSTEIVISNVKDNSNPEIAEENSVDTSIKTEDSNMPIKTNYKENSEGVILYVILALLSVAMIILAIFLRRKNDMIDKLEDC